jgi:ubiquinone/menaquinone biosynthesis C-methylase UbiE
LDNDSVDIVTVAQALHWFDFDKFYSNVKRVGKKDGIIAVWSYDMHKINPQIDKITDMLDVDGEILGSY